MPVTRILLLTLGGTISSESDPSTAPTPGESGPAAPVAGGAGGDLPRGGGGAGVVPRSGAEEFVAELAPWLRDVEVVGRGFRMLPSPSLRLEDLLDLHRTVLAAGDDGFDGVVVAQGTDTIEETAFVLDVLGTARSVPVVVTGAMRDREAAGTDGPANLVAAIDVAGSPAARGHGVLVVFADAIHAGRHVRKESATHASAFTSAPWGPLGLVHEREAHLPLRASTPPSLDAPSAEVAVPAVALIGTGVGDDLRLLPHLADLGYAGAVLEGMGGGHVGEQAVEAVRSLADRLPVVLTSRAGVGPTLRRTYGYPGGEIDLLAAGLLWGGLLTGPKARLLLTLALMDGQTGTELRSTVERLAGW